MRLKSLVTLILICAFFAACGTGNRFAIESRTPAAKPVDPAPPGNRFPQRQFIQCPEGMQPGIDYYPDEIIVGFKLQGFSSPTFATGKVPFSKGAMLNPVLYENEAIAEFAREIATDHNLALIPNGESYVKNVNFCAYKLEPDRDANDVAATLLTQYPDKVKYVEYNGISQLAYVPNDFYYVCQWALENIDAPNAWDITTGDTGQLIAVIDTGIQLDHEDLVGHITLPDDVYLDLYRGDHLPDDERGHGSMVSGVIAATTDNSVGIAGIAYSSKILPIKVFGGPEDGNASSSMIATAIQLAYSEGCKYINLSLGTYYPSTTLWAVCSQAFSGDVSIIAAAGNDMNPAPLYPGAFPEVINVGASDPVDVRAEYSNYGPTLDIVAPGGSEGGGFFDAITSTYAFASDSYYFASGTSLSAPHVTGVVALLRAYKPEISNLEARAMVEGNGEDVLDQSNWQTKIPLLRLNAALPLSADIPSNPEISIRNYSDMDVVGGEITLEPYIRPANDLVCVNYYIDGAFYDWTVQPPFDMPVNTSLLILGDHVFTAEAITKNHAHSYTSITLHVDNYGIVAQYWTGFENDLERAGWWMADIPEPVSMWQYEYANDNTHIYFGDLLKEGGRGYYGGDWGEVISPYIDLAGLINPKLYYTAKWNLYYDDVFKIRVLKPSGSVTTILQSNPQNEDFPLWTKSSIGLDYFEDLHVCFLFEMSIKYASLNGEGVWFDNIVVSDSLSSPSASIKEPSPAENSIVQGIVTFYGSASDDNEVVLNSRYLIDGQEIARFPRYPRKFNWDSAKVPDGQRVFTLSVDDELSYYGYSESGTESRTIYIHNTPLIIQSIEPSSTTTDQDIEITFESLETVQSDLLHVYFTGTESEIEGTVKSFSDNSLICTVPYGTETGKVKALYGKIPCYSADSLVIIPRISNFKFTIPKKNSLITDSLVFKLTSQPYADWIEYEILELPAIVLQKDVTPGDINLLINKSMFAINGKYTLRATAVASWTRITTEITFFVEVLPGDFNGDGVVDGDDLAVILGSIWAEPGDPDWIPYLDTNRNGIIEEDDAAVVGYNYGNT